LLVNKWLDFLLDSNKSWLLGKIHGWQILLKINLSLENLSASLPSLSQILHHYSKITSREEGGE
jgi:hypothetical protein